MSNPSDLRKVVIFFLNQMLPARGWNADSPVLSDNVIFCHATKDHGNGEEKAWGQVEFVIQLTTCRRPEILLLSEFHIINYKGFQIPILFPLHFLMHHGKRLVQMKSDLVEAKTDLWEIRSGANLQALFANYDDLAEWLGYTRLFSPEKTK